MVNVYRSCSLYDHDEYCNSGEGKRMCHYSLAVSLISPYLLWWPPTESHYNIYEHFAIGYVSHAHCIVLVYSVENKITTATHFLIYIILFHISKHDVLDSFGTIYTFREKFRRFIRIMANIQRYTANQLGGIMQPG